MPSRALAPPGIARLRQRGYPRDAFLSRLMTPLSIVGMAEDGRLPPL